MEIDITSLLSVDQFERSHSRMEGGDNAGQNTWRASLDAAKETVLLDNEEKLDAMRDFARSSGGWTAEEIAAWSAEEINALFLQWVAGDCRQCPAIIEGVEFEERFPGYWYFQTPKDKEEGMEDGPHESRHDAYKVASNEVVGDCREAGADSLDSIDWEEYRERCEAGQYAGSLYKSEDGRIYFSLSN